jgi:hypothetical protein
MRKGLRKLPAVIHRGCLPTSRNRQGTSVPLRHPVATDQAAVCQVGPAVLAARRPISLIAMVRWLRSVVFDSLRMKSSVTAGRISNICLDVNLARPNGPGTIYVRTI